MHAAVSPAVSARTARTGSADRTDRADRTARATARRGFRFVAALATAALVSITLSSCFVAAPIDPEGTGEEVSAELQPYYHQALDWRDCYGSMRCTTVQAPMDWNDPARASIDLALVLMPATGTKQGIILTNPGGPGASGVDTVGSYGANMFDAPLRASFDIVGFDPRGVGASSAVQCFDSDADKDVFLLGSITEPVGSDEFIAELVSSAQDFAADCQRLTGELLGYVDTVSAARDMDLLRAVLGQETLDYLGFSYGTFLGATYAHLYPGNVGKLVLDGAVDPVADPFQSTLYQVVGFESALAAYLRDCLAGVNCPFRGSVDDATAEIRSLFNELDEFPLPGADGRLLNGDAAAMAMVTALYSQETWGFLSQTFTAVMLGDPTLAFLFFDVYYNRNPDGSFSGNSLEAQIAVHCLDNSSDARPAVMRTEAEKLRVAAPTIGPLLSYGAVTCDQWPYGPDSEPMPLTAVGAPPILVIGTTNDPATPYAEAQELAAMLDSGVLITYNGEGHTAYNSSNACINDTVHSFFLNGTVPDADPQC